MKITKFEARDVNGYLNFNINFNDELTFLIGINGSGKTTAIKLILGLLSPSWINLTQIKYSYAVVECSIQNDAVLIRSEYIDLEKIKLSITFKNTPEKNATSTVRVQDIPIIQFNESNRFEMRHIMSRYTRYETNFVELDAVKRIKELSTPAFLGLDRRIHEGAEIDILSVESFMKERDYTSDIKGNLYESLLDVENLIKSSYLEFSQKQAAISSSLKNKLIYSSFDIIRGNDGELGININGKIDIETRKKRIIEASRNFEIPDLESKIIFYFDELHKIQTSIQSESAKKKKGKENGKEFMKLFGQWFINSPQLERIDRIISLYEDAQIEIESIYKDFIKFETLTNLYFSENSKRLLVQKNGEIEIILPNKNSSSIYKLSSGEKQIIVMLAQLIFGKKRNIFIIDEPELSLHLGWQEIFVKSLTEASASTQFILATHSPTIIGNISNQTLCEDLTQNNLEEINVEF